MQNFSNIFALASLMVCEYQEQYPWDKVFFKYSSNKPNFIIEVLPNSRTEKEYLVSFNLDRSMAFVALRGFYNYMAMKGFVDVDAEIGLLIDTLKDGEVQP